MPSESPIVVLEATNPPDGTTRYIDQVVTFAPRDIQFQFLSLRNLVRQRFDVLHVHWPEVLVRSRRPVVTWLRCGLLVLLLTVLRARRVPIVRTLHNVEPHEPGGRLEKATLRLLDRWTAHVVAINPTTPVPEGRSSFIPHGHYRDRFAGLDKSATVTGRVLYAGLIRPYKGVEKLIEVIGELSDPAITLRLVGRPTEDLRSRIEGAISSDDRISARFEFVPDADFVREMTAAELVCLPYEELHNSGILLVALSLDRPVLVPDTAATRALELEVGPGWVHRYTGALSSEALMAGLQSVRDLHRTAEPALENRDWHRVGEAYASVFRTVDAKRRRKERA